MCSTGGVSPPEPSVSPEAQVLPKPTALRRPQRTAPRGKAFWATLAFRGGTTGLTRLGQPPQEVTKPPKGRSVPARSRRPGASHCLAAGEAAPAIAAVLGWSGHLSPSFSLAGSQPYPLSWGPDQKKHDALFRCCSHLLAAHQKVQQKGLTVAFKSPEMPVCVIQSRC